MAGNAQPDAGAGPPLDQPARAWEIAGEGGEEPVRLGQTALRVSPIGVGTVAWGDSLVWGYGRGYGDDDLQAAFAGSVAAGISLFDTAEIYGWGRSERLLGRFARSLPAHQAAPVPVLATKFFPFPWRLRRADLRRAVRGSLSRLGCRQIDLYQIHWPTPLVSVEARMDALADVVQAGSVRAVGVSNYGAAELHRAHDALARRGIPLASNQVHYSLLHRRPERDGVLRACRELGVTLIAYSPLELGLLSGKYGRGRPMPWLRRRRYRGASPARLEPLLGALRQIGHAHGGRSPAQVALNWLLGKGTLPIPGAKDARQARDNAGAMGWRLTAAEMDTLDRLSAPLSLSP
jgi:aryl-alcohol dehydrogenase-like predicted oxidoreductase